MSDITRKIDVQLSVGKPASISNLGSSMAKSACIDCVDTPCMTFSQDEIGVTGLEEFPHTNELATCAFDVLGKNIAGRVEIANPSACIGCGVCSARCPVSAIYFTDSTTPAISRGIVEYEDLSENTPLEDVSYTGSNLDYSEDSLDRIYRALTLKTRGPNTEKTSRLLSRNLLLVCGLEAIATRQGVTSTRMDLLVGIDGVVGTVEIEFGALDSLNGPRRLLDDVAVLRSRHKLSGEILPIVLLDQLPNRRSDYWRVVDDISNVLGLEIVTLPIFALIFAARSRSLLRLESVRLFYKKLESESMRATLLKVFSDLQLDGMQPKSYLEVAK